MNYQPFAHLMWLLPLAILVVYMGSPRFLGTMGAVRVRRILNAALEKNRYTLMHDLTLPGGGGTVHFDHIIVSRCGVHVIDTVHRAGWIAGTDVQARWRQKVLGRWYTFDNPVHANILRVEALGRLLQLPLSRFHPMVVFSGHKGFKAAMPANVVSMSKLIGKIRADARQLLTPEEVDRAVLKLQNSALHTAFFGRVWRWKLLGLVLFMGLVVAVYFIYGEQLRAVLVAMQHQANVSMAPENFHPDGKPKSEIELWEDRLVCAYSVDTGRCACFEPAGAKARIQQQRCEELAQRGSILQQ